MTRFQMEISGKLGEFWKKHAEEEVLKKVEQAKKDATVDSNGVIRWNSNGRCIPDDYCEKLEYAGFDFSREATRKARDLDNEEWLNEYRANQKESSTEEMSEMRAAFGAGTTVVDILSRREVRL